MLGSIRWTQSNSQAHFAVVYFSMKSERWIMHYFKRFRRTGPFQFVQNWVDIIYGLTLCPVWKQSKPGSNVVCHVCLCVFSAPGRQCSHVYWAISRDILDGRLEVIRWLPFSAGHEMHMYWQTILFLKLAQEMGLVLLPGRRWRGGGPLCWPSEKSTRKFVAVAWKKKHFFTLEECTCCCCCVIAGCAAKQTHQSVILLQYHCSLESCYVPVCVNILTCNTNICM